MKKRSGILLSLRAIAAMAMFFLLGMKIQDTGEFSWNKTTHDFDRILRGHAYTYRFTFTNSGDEPILIKDVKSSSPFAVAKWTTTAVRPLGNGFVDITLTPIKAGPEMVSFKVVSNSGTPETTLWLKGEVMTDNEMKAPTPPLNGTR